MVWWLMAGVILGLLAFLWVVYDIFKNQKAMSAGKKALWIAVTLIFGLLGAGAYYLVEKRA